MTTVFACFLFADLDSPDFYFGQAYGCLFEKFWKRLHLGLGAVSDAPMTFGPYREGDAPTSQIFRPGGKEGFVIRTFHVDCAGKLDRCCLPGIRIGTGITRVSEVFLACDCWYPGCRPWMATIGLTGHSSPRGGLPE